MTKRQEKYIEYANYCKNLCREGTHNINKDLARFIEQIVEDVEIRELTYGEVASKLQTTAGKIAAVYPLLVEVHNDKFN